MSELPLGFAMALAKNYDALSAFVKLDKEKKQAIVDGVKNIESKQQMQQYVNSLTQNIT